MSLLNEVKSLLRRYRIIPKKHLGQNFLVNENILQEMVYYASLKSKDTVLEVGAGLGFLTERLAEKAGRVIAVEIDDKLVRALRRRLMPYDNVTVIHGDIMKVKIPQFNKVVSTPPYFISSPLHFWLLNKRFEEAILSFQEEFARRLTATPGSRDYGRLTVATYYRAEAEILRAVPKEAFWPRPKVDSSIVRLKPRNPPFSVTDEKLFFEVVNVIFTQRNKKLRNALIPFFSRFRIPSKDSVKIAEALPFYERRPRDLSPEEIGLVVDGIFKELHSMCLIR